MELSLGSIDWELLWEAGLAVQSSEHATHSLLRIKRTVEEPGWVPGPPTCIQEWGALGVVRSEAHTCMFPGEVQRASHRGAERPRDP